MCTQFLQIIFHFNWYWFGIKGSFGFNAFNGKSIPHRIFSLTVSIINFFTGMERDSLWKYENSVIFRVFWYGFKMSTMRIYSVLTGTNLNIFAGRSLSVNYFSAKLVWQQWKYCLGGKTDLLPFCLCRAKWSFSALRFSLRISIQLAMKLLS